MDLVCRGKSLKYMVSTKSLDNFKNLLILELKLEISFIQSINKFLYEVSLV